MIKILKEEFNPRNFEKYGFKCNPKMKGLNEQGQSSVSSSVVMSDSDIEKAPNITYILKRHDVDVATREEIGRDMSYRKLLTTMRAAERFNYHSDYWGSAEEYQQDNVDLVEDVEDYVGKHVAITFEDEDGPVVFKLLGVLVDTKYNSISHTRLLVEEVGDITASTDDGSTVTSKDVTRFLKSNGITLNPELATAESIAEYINISRANGLLDYDMDQWYKDTQTNYPEYFVDDHDVIDRMDENGEFESDAVMGGSEVGVTIQDKIPDLSAAYKKFEDKGFKKVYGFSERNEYYCRYYAKLNNDQTIDMACVSLYTDDTDQVKLDIATGNNLDLEGAMDFVIDQGDSKDFFDNAIKPYLPVKDDRTEEEVFNDKYQKSVEGLTGDYYSLKDQTSIDLATKDRIKRAYKKYKDLKHEGEINHAQILDQISVKPFITKWLKSVLTQD